MAAPGHAGFLLGEEGREVNMKAYVTISMDQKCAECGKGGSVPSGICMKCTVKAMDQAAVMRSREGRAVQARWKSLKPKRQEGA